MFGEVNDNHECRARASATIEGAYNVANECRDAAKTRGRW